MNKPIPTAKVVKKKEYSAIDEVINEIGCEIQINIGRIKLCTDIQKDEEREQLYRKKKKIYEEIYEELKRGKYG